MVITGISSEPSTVHQFFKMLLAFLSPCYLGYSACTDDNLVLYLVLRKLSLVVCGRCMFTSEYWVSFV